LVQLASIGVTTTYYIDSLLAREESYTFLDTFWVR
jgi:mannitol/fructose-specific phosphotransferase system IIA component